MKRDTRRLGYGSCYFEVEDMFGALQRFKIFRANFQSFIDLMYPVLSSNNI